MKIVIEDYYGNDICSFVVNLSQCDVLDLDQFVDCNYADMEVDENSEAYIRIQLEK